MRNKKADFNTFGGEKHEFQTPDYGVTSPDYPLGGHNVPWLLRTPPDPKRRTPPFSTPLGPKRSSNMRRS